MFTSRFSSSTSSNFAPLKKISFEHLKSRDFDPSSWAPPLIFQMTSTSKLGAVSVKSSLLNKSFSEKKIIADLLQKLLKLE